MAPYAIAHMKIGIKLYETGYRFKSKERARIYLTNALEPPSDIQAELEVVSPALAHEAKAVNEIKRHKRFTVVIGNPPYAGDSLNPSIDTAKRLTFIGRLIEDYKLINGIQIPDKNLKGLQDDYVKFFRYAQWVLDATDLGVLGYVTNHAYLDASTFTGFRKSLMESFNSLQLLDLHGCEIRPHTQLAKISLVVGNIGKVTDRILASNLPCSLLAVHHV